MYDSIYDEAFGPSNPHTIAYREDFSWQDEPVWDDDLAVVIAFTGDEDTAADLFARITETVAA